MSCSLGGYIIRRHNDIQDLLAGMLNKVAKDVSIEPALTPLTGENFQRKSTT